MRTPMILLLAAAVFPLSALLTPRLYGAPSETAKTDRYDKIIDDFIQYDIGRLRGEAGQIAHREFHAINNKEALPALVRGVNKAARIRSSCPIIVIANKLQGLIQETNDRELLAHVRDNLDSSGQGVFYKAYVDRLGELCSAKLGERSDAQTLRGGGTAGQLKRSRIAIEEWSAEDLVQSITEDKDTDLVRTLEELKNRKGSQYTDAMARAIKLVDEETRPLARGLLTQRLTRMKDTTLRAKLEDSDPEVRAAAARAVGYKGSPLYRELAVALRDKDRRVAKDAHGVLVKMLGEDLGPSPDATKVTDWFLASKRWEKWLEEKNTREEQNENNEQPSQE